MSPKLEQALELIREDRPEAVEQALALLQNTVYSFSMKVCGHPQDAEDTMQDVLVKLLPYLPKFDNPQALSVWLYKVASNRCLMNRRGAKNAANKHVSLDELMPSQYELRELIESKDPNPETNVLRDENNRRVREAMLKVAPLYRMVLVLHDMEGLNTANVARVTGLTQGTVRVRLHRGRLMLRQQLARMAKAKGIVVDLTHAVADDGSPKRPRHCREMFASLSDYMDGLVNDAAQRRNAEASQRLQALRRISRQLEVGRRTVPHLRTGLRHRPRRRTSQRVGREVPGSRGGAADESTHGSRHKDLSKLVELRHNKLSLSVASRNSRRGEGSLQ